MTVAAGKSKSGLRTVSTTKADFGGSEFSEKEYKAFLMSRSKIHNGVARKNRNTSIFDAMKAVDGEFKKKIYDGMSIDDMFKSLK